MTIYEFESELEKHVSELREALEKGSFERVGFVLGSMGEKCTNEFEERVMIERFKEVAKEFKEAV